MTLLDNKLKTTNYNNNNNKTIITKVQPGKKQQEKREMEDKAEEKTFIEERTSELWRQIEIDILDELEPVVPKNKEENREMEERKEQDKGKCLKEAESTPTKARKSIGTIKGISKSTEKTTPLTDKRRITRLGSKTIRNDNKEKPIKQASEIKYTKTKAVKRRTNEFGQEINTKEVRGKEIQFTKLKGRTIRIHREQSKENLPPPKEIKRTIKNVKNNEIEIESIQNEQFKEHEELKDTII